MSSQHPNSTSGSHSLQQQSITQDSNSDGNGRGFPVRNLKILGLVQIVISGISCYLGVIGRITGASYRDSVFDIRLFLTTFCLSIWFILTGCIPLCISRQRRNNWKYLKVSFMSCSILGGFAFVFHGDTIIMCIEFLQYAIDKGTKALSIITAITVLLEAVVAIVSAFYCTLSAWNSSFPVQQGSSSNTIDNFTIRGIRICGLVQIVSESISCILSVVGIIIYRNDDYALPFFSKCLIISVWFFLTGCIPMATFGQRQNNRKYLKLLFMAFNVLGIIAFVVIWPSDAEVFMTFDTVFIWVTTSKVILDLIFAVISIFFCCCTDWDTTNQQNIYMMTTPTSSNGRCPDMRNEPAVLSQQANSTIGSPSPQHRLALNQGDVTVVQRGSVPYHGVVHQSDNLSTTAQGTTDTMGLYPTSITEDLNIDGNERGFPVRNLKILGLVQILISCITFVLSLIAMIKDGPDVSYMFPTTLFLSIWFVLTGCIPMCIASQSWDNWKYFKVLFMSCSCLGGFAFVIHFDAILESIMVLHLTPFKGAVAVTVLLEVVVAIVSAFYCNFTAWNSSFPAQQGLSANTSVPNERMFPVTSLRILGLVQIVSGVILCILSIIGHIIENMFFFNKCHMLSVWFILTGCVPMSISRQNNRTHPKVLFTAFNVLGVIACVVICPFPFMFLKGSPAIYWITAGTVLENMIVAVISIFFCLCTKWDTTTYQVERIRVNEVSSVFSDTREVGSLNNRTQDQLESGDREGEADEDTEDDTEDSSPLLKGLTRKQERP